MRKRGHVLGHDMIAQEFFFGIRISSTQITSKRLATHGFPVEDMSSALVNDGITGDVFVKVHGLQPDTRTQQLLGTLN